MKAKENVSEEFETIGQFAKRFRLSRSTLLYYDRIGLLHPIRSTRNAYRFYGPAERRRMEKINLFRSTGVPLSEIILLLNNQSTAEEVDLTLERHLHNLTEQIKELEERRQLLAAMILRGQGEPEIAQHGRNTINVDLWVQMLTEAGLDKEGRRKWHQSFEREAPDHHERFLRFLGIADSEIKEIRKRAGNG